MAETLRVKLKDIPEPGARRVCYQSALGEQESLVVRYNGEVRVYVNSCPHTGVSLNWANEYFFEPEHKFLQCSTHGALFQPLDGRCIHGPCVGESLKALDFELVEQYVIIYI